MGEREKVEVEAIETSKKVKAKREGEEDEYKLLYRNLDL